ncbi:hypothetical protein D6851_00160 [Altericroceibacterium spongiae]|uniref:Uncharacterized protein n=1 Tax=Altericroceibacterium spongiae TaxID=2320269 RepID=A0A420EQL9_9SPHN|nr:hypothetical protein [Altericroceibacterium spongiae]RKF22972.1 hypothetical protein D6851_00160 [Altericroceibacterium spongiae]
MVVASRSAAFGNLFGQNQLLPFQFFDPLFIGFDDCAAVGLYETVHDLRKLPLDTTDFQTHLRHLFAA